MYQQYSNTHFHKLFIAHPSLVHITIVVTRSCYSGFQLLEFTSTLGVYVGLLSFRMLFTSFHLLSVLRIYSS